MPVLGLGYIAQAQAFAVNGILVFRKSESDSSQQEETDAEDLPEIDGDFADELCD